MRVISLLCFKPTTLIVDFQRAKRAIEALSENKIGNPSSRGNLIMTSPYDRPSTAQTLVEGEGCLNATAISGVMTLNYNAFHIPLEVTLTTRLG